MFDARKDGIMNPFVMSEPPEPGQFRKRATRPRRMAVYAVCLALFIVALGCKGTTARPEGTIDDRAIVAHIRSLISKEPALDAAAIRVFAQEGKVTLSGPVPDTATKARLLDEARGVEGVKSVSDDLQLPH